MVVGALAAFLCVGCFFAFVKAPVSDRSLPSVHTDLPAVTICFFVIAVVMLGLAGIIASHWN